MEDIANVESHSLFDYVVKDIVGPHWNTAYRATILLDRSFLFTG